VAYQLNFWPAADDALAALEADPRQARALAAIERMLDRLEEGPYEPSLGTIAFVSEIYRTINATPVRSDEWYILWKNGPSDHELDIVLIHQLRPS
jgi:hypothetical protein